MYTTAREQGEETGPSSLCVVKSAAPKGISINDIPRYVDPTWPGVKPRKLTKNQRYPPKLPPLPEGMIFLGDIISALTKMKYEDHDFLLLKDVTDEPYQLVPTIPSAPILWIPHPWAQGLDKSRLLGLINMPHFGRLNEENACVKKLLACFHVGMLWLNKPI